MSEKLKPCPFCGSEAISYDIGGLYFARCKNPKCGVELNASSARKIIRMWNTRANHCGKLYALLHKTLLLTWSLAPHITEKSVLDELYTCASEIEKALLLTDDYEDEL